MYHLSNQSEIYFKYELNKSFSFQYKLNFKSNDLIQFFYSLRKKIIKHTLHNHYVFWMKKKHLIIIPAFTNF